MTFHGKPRADDETMHHVHESPWVMLIPLFVLAAGATFAGYLAEQLFCRRRARPRSGRPRSWCCRRTIRSRAAEHNSALIDYLPLIAARARHRGWPISAICCAPASRAAAAMQFRALYLFLLNKWYFDELYDRLFVQQRLLARRGAVEDRRRHDHRWAWARRHRRGDARTGARGQPAADRLCLPLRVRHADRRRRAGHLVPVAAVSAPMDSKPDEPLAAPLARHLSAAGWRRVHHDGARRGLRSSRATRATSRCRPRSSSSPCRSCCGSTSIRRPPPSSLSSGRAGSRSAGSRSTITWGSTASRCSSCCCRPC